MRTPTPTPGNEEDAEPIDGAEFGPHERRSSDFVQSLDRGLAVIRAFGPGRVRLTLSEVARETGLTRAAARRFLLTLVELGYVHSEGREFSLRPRVLELGYAYLSGMTVSEVAQPLVETLVHELQESATVGVLDDDEVVCILRVPARRIMVVALPVGSRVPASVTSMGRVLLGGLSPRELDRYLAKAKLEPTTARAVADPDKLRDLVAESRSNGYAVVDQELEDGLRTIGVPIREPSGAVVAALAVPAHAARVSIERLQGEFLPKMRATVNKIEADLRAQSGRAPAIPAGD